MIQIEEARALIENLFEEQALAIGGLVAVHGMEDDLVWRLVRCLDAIRSKALGRIEEAVTLSDRESLEAAERVRPHPAIEAFLLKVRRAQGGASRGG